MRDDGTVLYRGLSMPKLGRLLTAAAQYAAWTGDGALLLRHVRKLGGVLYNV